jgi:Holliday junction resolvasome RuvABC DNA-binding subunit
MRNAVQQAEVKYHIGDVGRFGSANGNGSTKPTVERGGATDSQVAALVNLGVEREMAQRYGKKQAGAVMDSLMKNRCTDRQAKTLQKYGYNPSEFNVKQASAKITEIADNGWKRPD